jgi:hypothetical protein
VFVVVNKTVVLTFFVEREKGLGALPMVLEDQLCCANGTRVGGLVLVVANRPLVLRLFGGLKKGFGALAMVLDDGNGTRIGK